MTFTLHLVGQFLVDLQRPKEPNQYFEQSAAQERYGFYLNNLSGQHLSHFQPSNPSLEIIRSKKNQV